MELAEASRRNLAAHNRVMDCGGGEDHRGKSTAMILTPCSKAPSVNAATQVRNHVQIAGGRGKGRASNGAATTGWESRTRLKELDHHDQAIAVQMG
jgi:hypothetical protein